jgi:hypothetical protein
MKLDRCKYGSLEVMKGVGHLLSLEKPQETGKTTLNPISIYFFYASLSWNQNNAGTLWKTGVLTIYPSVCIYLIAIADQISGFLDRVLVSPVEQEQLKARL